MTIRTIFIGLWAAFIVQIAGRLLDLQWHSTHPEFETGQDQVRAHWLVWLGSLLLVAVAARALRADLQPAERRGYLTALISNLLYGAGSIVHFLQHLDHQEVDWAHVALAATNLGSVAGVLIVTFAHVRSPSPSSEAVL